MDTLTTQHTFWQHYFGVSNQIAFQTLVPVAITLFVFVSGFILTRWREHSKEKKNSRLIKSFILAQLDVVIKATAIQISHLDKFLSQLHAQKVMNFEFEIAVDFNTKHLRYIKSNELFNVLVIDSERENKIEEFNSLIKQLDLIDGLNDSFKSSFAYTIKHLNSYQNNWNENIDIIGDLHDKWLTHLTIQNIDPRTDPFLKQFIEIYHQWALTDNRRDMYVAVDSLIIPVLEKARSLQPNVYGEALLRPLLHCFDAYANHKNLREIKIDEFGRHKQKLQSIENELKKFIEEFK